jgi:dolichyl-phosphate-mannose--protein O-mannosyl transferase
MSQTLKAICVLLATRKISVQLIYCKDVKEIVSLTSLTLCLLQFHKHAQTGEQTSESISGYDQENEAMCCDEFALLSFGSPTLKKRERGREK